MRTHDKRRTARARGRARARSGASEAAVGSVRDMVRAQSWWQLRRTSIFVLAWCKFYRWLVAQPTARRQLRHKALRFRVNGFARPTSALLPLSTWLVSKARVQSTVQSVLLIVHY